MLHIIVEEHKTFLVSSMLLPHVSQNHPSLQLRISHCYRG